MYEPLIRNCRAADVWLQQVGKTSPWGACCPCVTVNPITELSKGDDTVCQLEFCRNLILGWSTSLFPFYSSSLKTFIYFFSLLSHGRSLCCCVAYQYNGKWTSIFCCNWGTQADTTVRVVPWGTAQYLMWLTLGSVQTLSSLFSMGTRILFPV